METFCQITLFSSAQKITNSPSFFLFRQAKRARHENKHTRATALVPRARPPLTNPEEKERLLAV